MEALPFDIGPPASVPVDLERSERDAWLCDLVARLLIAHGLDPQLAADAGGVAPSDVADMLAGVTLALDDDQHQRLMLFANIVIRLEWRLRGDSVAVRRALVTPLAALGGRAPAEQMVDGLDALRVVRLAIDTVDTPKVRWWRVADRDE